MPNQEMKLPEDSTLMESEPLPDLSPDEIREWYARHPGEADLSAAFAAVSNKYAWVEDNEYDYAEGSPEHKEACRVTDAWESLMDELENDIFRILKKEGVTIPERGQIDVLSPFMERNGYYNGAGWWIPKERA